MNAVYHGRPEKLLNPPTHEKPEYRTFLGRICPEKRRDLAIKIAAQSGLPLKISARVDKLDEKYFKTTIEPLLSLARVEFVGEINELEKSEFLSGAEALLFPIDWHEPFGLLMIEAMACSTPVIAFNHGSVPEVIDRGVTGNIARTRMVRRAPFNYSMNFRAFKSTPSLNGSFTAATMAQAYVETYMSLVRAAKRPVSRRVTVG